MTSPEIEEYEFGRIRIDGDDYRTDVIIFPDHVESDWWREQGHSLSVADLGSVLEREPGRLIVGCGANGRMRVPAATRRALEQAGIEVLSEPTHQAVDIYNRLREGSDVVAALHLTC